MNKKILSLLTATLAVGALFGSGCDKEDKPQEQQQETEEKLHLDTTGGTEKQQKTIDAVLATSIVLINDKTVLGGTTRTHALVGDENPYIMYLTKMNNVEFEWDIDTTNPLIAGIREISETQRMIEFNFPKKGEANPITSFQFKLTKAKLGDCVSVDGQFIPYNFSVTPETLVHDKWSIHDLTKLNDTNPEQYNVLDYSLASPYYPTNNPDAPDDKQYLYVDVKGEVVYLAPDGNWGLLQEGDDIIEFYAGSSKRMFKEKYWPGLKVGAKVEMSGNMSQYKGNIQMGFITKIRILSGDEANAVTAGTRTYAKITEETINGWRYITTKPSTDSFSATVNKDCFLNAKFIGTPGSERCVNAIDTLTFALKSDGWYFGDKKVDFEELGISILGTPAVGSSLQVAVKEKQVVANNMNALKEVTGTIVPDSWYKDTTKATVANGFNYQARNSFKLQVGDEVITIAYDYHTIWDKYDSVMGNQEMLDKMNSIFYNEVTGLETLDDYVGLLVEYMKSGTLTRVAVTDANKSKLNIEPGVTKAYENKVGTDKAITIKGSLRYNGIEKGKVFLDDQGQWELTPMDETSISFAE